VSREGRFALFSVSASLAAAAIAVALVLTSDHETQSTFQAVAGDLIGLSFTTAGLLGSLRRPGNRTGALLSLVGFTFFAGALGESNHALVSTVGSALQELFLAAFLHLMLAYPAGTLTREAKRVVVTAYVAAVGFPIAYLLTSRTQPGCAKCPDSAFTIHQVDTLRRWIPIVAAVVAIGLVLATIRLLVVRWRSASPVYRSSFRLVLISGGCAVALLGVQLVANPFVGRIGDVVIGTLGAISFLFVPFAFVAGLLRGRFAGAAVGRLVADLGPAPAPGRLLDALRDVLGDPELELGYWLPDLPGYVDIEGRPFDPEARGATTPVDGPDGPIGILAHDPALRERQDLLDGVVAAARLALENERLHAALRAQLAELARERDFTRLVVNTAPTYFCVVDGDGLVVRFNETLERAAAVDDDAATRGRPFWDVFTSPEEADAVRGAIGLTAATGQTSRHENVLVAADGTRRRVAWIDAPIPDEHGQMRYVLVCGLDVTEGRWHEDVQGTLRRVATLVAAGAEESDLMEVVTAEVGRLFDGDSANLLQMTGDASVITGGWSRDGVQTWAAGTVFPVVGDTATGRAMASLRPARVDSPDELEEEVARELWRAHDTESTVAAPIVVDAALWGVISVSRMTTELFPVDAAERLGDFAALIAQAIANASAQAEVRASRARLVAAADAERKKLERNLHDGAQQRLVSISIALRLAHAKLQAAPSEASALLAGASDELALALDELRELARGIHPAVLTDRGLAPALTSLAERAPIPVTIAGAFEERLPMAVEAAAYYVVAESLTNVAKYAAASAVAIVLEHRNGCARVEVRDDGVGGADPTRGSGLRGLADRVEALSGRLGVESVAGTGTTVWAEIPCV
jgi:PAS domain S-box-containing protein